MGKLFGTDGIRGVANDGLDAELAYKVGQAAAIVLTEQKHGKAVIAIGKDTRISGDMLEAALIAGVCSAGADVMQLGVIPTPAVAYLTKACGADAGVVISASHNPYEHNGIKIFNSKGFKLSDETEEKIEELILSGKKPPLKVDGEIGVVRRDGRDKAGMYVDYLRSTVKGEISGLKVLVDCANGAASATAGRLFGGYPIDATVINCRPNGVNINDNCGSTHLEGLCGQVIDGGYDIGIAFDGDADRCLFVDEAGNEIDGDKIMAVCGTDMKREGTLCGNTIVATVMSNLGFRRYAESCGIALCTADVGDRYVLEKMMEGGYLLGGEQSGHIIFLEFASTGDGQLTALQFLSVMCRTGLSASELVRDVPQYPQVLVNVPLNGGNEAKREIMLSAELAAETAKQEELLGKDGRILVRPSGTEALIRVMVEAKDDVKAAKTAGILANLIKNMANKKQS